MLLKAERAFNVFNMKVKVSYLSSGVIKLNYTPVLMSNYCLLLTHLRADMC